MITATKPSQSQIAAMTAFYGSIEVARNEWKRAAKISKHVKPVICEDGRIVSLCSNGFKECYSFTVARDYTTAEFSRGMHHATLHEWVGRSFEDFDKGMSGRGFSRVAESFDMGDRGIRITYYYVK
jgi:hypothetical protein